MRLLLVEDDAILAENLVDAISSHDYIVDQVGDGESAWQQLQSVNYDLILLDLMLPRLDGISLCRRLRLHKNQTLILMLTALDTLKDQVIGLDAGADDYVVKPFDLTVLLARIRALLRRGQVSLSPLLAWGPLCLNPNTYTVTCQDQPLTLTPKEFLILEQLLRYGEKILKRSTLIDRVWSYDNPPTQATIRVHIQTLRRKLTAAGCAEDMITTIHGVGYCLKRPSTEPNAGSDII